MASLGRPLFLRTVGDPSSPIAAIARWQHDGAVINVAASNTLRLVVSLRDGQRVRGEAGAKVAADRVRVGSISLFPASEDTRLEVEGSADTLQIFLRSDRFAAILDDHFVAPTLFDSHDVGFQAAAMQVLTGAAGERPDDVLLLEAGLKRLMSRLSVYLGEEASIRPRDRLARGGLSPTTFRRVDEMIAGAISGSGVRSLTLSELAVAADLSVSHFLRAFQRHTGETPHRHIVRRRLERAIALLQESAVSVAEVADETGFATPAHFVATFRRIMGVTPGALHHALAA